MIYKGHIYSKENEIHFHQGNYFTTSVMPVMDKKGEQNRIFCNNQDMKQDTQHVPETRQ